MKKFSRIIAVLMAMLMVMSVSVLSANAAFIETGDANMDSKINVKDATIIQKSAADLAVLGDSYYADVNYDDQVNVKDATAIQKYSAGIGDTIEEAAGVDLTAAVELPTEPKKGDVNPAKDFYYKVKTDGTVKILAYVGTDKTVTIPEKLEGKTVTEIGKCAFSTSLEISSLDRDLILIDTLWIPDTVTTLGAGFVAYQHNLTDLRLPAGTKEIPSCMALQCYNLKNFVVPAAVEKIAYAAFEDCRSMKAYALPETCTVIETEAFTRNDRLVSINLDKVKSIGEWAFFECNLLAPVLKLDAIESLGAHAFQACRSVTDITLGENLKAISNDAFKNIFKLKNVTLPEGLESIGSLAFAACHRIENCKIPAGCTVAKNAFDTSRPEFY